MKISILTVFPELYESFLNTTLVAKAQEKGLISFDLKKFTDFVRPKERIDAPKCGHGAGMLIRPDVVEKAVDIQESAHGSAYKIFFSPQGKKLDQQLLVAMHTSMQKHNKTHLMLISGRYEGMDIRVEQYYADQVISIGDYVLMGGDLPAMVFLEGFLRHVPQIVGRSESVEHDSFSGPFVDFPEYTLPVTWQGMQIPDVIRSGNHQAVDVWRHDKAVVATVQNHFEWLRKYPLSTQQKKDAARCIPAHYVVLLHSDVLVGQKRELGTTSVTSIDVHDIARSARTYGLKTFFIVTPLLDQQKIVGEFLSFWKEGHGVTYNANRHEAVAQVQVCSSLDEVISLIERAEGAKPLAIATSAQTSDHEKTITFSDQQEVWQHRRPVLFLLGTGQGIAQHCIEKTDYLLTPVGGFTEYNHLSVRSAAAIIFDRWLGLNPHRIE